MEARKEKIDSHISSLFGGLGVSHVDKGHESHLHQESDYSGILIDDVLKAQRNSLIPVIECEQLQKARLILDEHELECNVIYI